MTDETTPEPIEVDVLVKCRRCHGFGATGHYCSVYVVCFLCEGAGKCKETLPVAPGSYSEAVYRAGLAAIEAAEPTAVRVARALRDGN